VGFFTGFDDRQSRPRLREDERRHPRPGDRDVHAHAPLRGGPAQRVANRARRAEQAPESADVDCHEIVPVDFETRREVGRDADERGATGRGRVRNGRLVHTRVQRRRASRFAIRESRRISRHRARRSR
jgi:hypothetical protein